MFPNGLGEGDLTKDSEHAEPVREFVNAISQRLLSANVTELSPCTWDSHKLFTTIVLLHGAVAKLFNGVDAPANSMFDKLVSSSDAVKSICDYVCMGPDAGSRCAKDTGLAKAYAAVSAESKLKGLLEEFEIKPGYLVRLVGDIGPILTESSDHVKRVNTTAAKHAQKVLTQSTGVEHNTRFCTR